MTIPAGAWPSREVERTDLWDWLAFGLAVYFVLTYLVIYSLLTLTESVAVTYNDIRWSIFVALAVKLAWRGRE